MAELFCSNPKLCDTTNEQTNKMITNTRLKPISNLAVVTLECHTGVCTYNLALLMLSMYKLPNIGADASIHSSGIVKPGFKIRHFVLLKNTVFF